MALYCTYHGLHIAKCTPQTRMHIPALCIFPVPEVAASGTIQLRYLHFELWLAIPLSPRSYLNST